MCQVKHPSSAVACYGGWATGDGRSHDVVGAYGEAKMKSSQGEPEGISKATRGLFPEKGTELRGFGHTDPLGSSQIFKNQAGLSRASRSNERLSTGSSSMTLMTFMTPEHLGHVRGSTFPNQVRGRLQTFG